MAAMSAGSVSYTHLDVYKRQFLTIPITSFGTTAAGASVLNADKPVTTALFQALAAEKMPQILLKNPGIGQLKAPNQVR